MRRGKPREACIGELVAEIIDPPEVKFRHLHEIREDNERVAKLWAMASVPERYGEANLSKWENVPKPDQAKYRVVVDKVSKLLSIPAMIVLCGNRGTGKTWLACGLVKEFCRQRRRGMYADVSDYFLALDHGRETEKKSAYMVEKDYIKPEFLVLDAMEDRADTPAKDRMLISLINHRYNGVKPTLMITNEMPEQFSKRVGSTIHDRIRDGGGIIECKWESFRGRIK